MTITRWTCECAEADIPSERFLVTAVREVTAPFKNVTNPSEVGDAYAHLFGCVSGGDFGAMGLHFVKGDILHDGEVNAELAGDSSVRAGA